MVRVVPRFTIGNDGQEQKDRMSNFYELYPAANAPRKSMEQDVIPREKMPELIHDLRVKLERGKG